MITIEHKIKLHAPKAKVSEALTNLEEVSQYNSTIKSAKYISENKKGIGASRQCEMDKGSVKERVTGVDEGTSISMELYESDWPLNYMGWTTTLSEEAGVTTLTQVTEYEPGMGVLGKIMNVLMMK